MEWDFTFSYTRAQAIADSVLIDVSDIAKEAGFKIPVALTSALYDTYIKSDLPGQDEQGRLWDTLFMLYLRAKGCEESIIFYEVLFQMSESEQKTVKLKAIIGPGDTMDPVLTIMLPEED